MRAARIQTLTPAEETVMQILWRLKKAMVKDILAEMPEPKPAYNTVSTVVRVLEKKKMVGHSADGNKHVYYSLITGLDYVKFSVNKMLNGYFDNSYKNLVSYLVKGENLTTDELTELQDLIKTIKKKP
jgi:BlaI family penicillinase repressor